MKLKDTPWKKSYDQPRQHIKKQRPYFTNKAPSSQSYGFSSSHVWMWELDHKEGWALKDWFFWTVVVAKRLLGVSWTVKRSNKSNFKEIRPEYSLEGLMLKLKLQYFGHLIKRANSLRDRDAGKNWRQEMRGWDGWWQNQLDGHEFEQDPREGEGQGSLACCSPRGHRESDWTELLNDNSKYLSLSNKVTF